MNADIEYREGVPTLIAFWPAAPCGTTDPDKPGGICGNPATVGTLYRPPNDFIMPGQAAGPYFFFDTPKGELVLLPVCLPCTQKLLKLYFPPNGETA